MRNMERTRLPAFRGIESEKLRKFNSIQSNFIRRIQQPNTMYDKKIYVLYTTQGKQSLSGLGRKLNLKRLSEKRKIEIT